MPCRYRDLLCDKFLLKTIFDYIKGKQYENKLPLSLTRKHNWMDVNKKLCINICKDVLLIIAS